MKVVVLGFDGMEPSLVDEMISQNKLPNIQELVDNGVRSDMQSTLVPISAMAWSSFITGTNPGKHGIYDFVIRDNPNDHSFSVASADDRRSPDMCDYMSTTDKNIGVIGMPLTYPVNNKADIMISGYPTPSEENSYTPESLEQNLDSKPSETQPRIHFSGDNHEKFLKDQRRQFNSVRSIHNQILEDYDLDLQITVFKQTDDIAHVSWDEDPVKDVYMKADEVVGETVERLESQDEEYNIIVMSDHGFGEIKGTLFLNNLLRRTNNLEIKRSLGSRTREKLSDVGFNQLNVFKFLSAIGLGERTVSAGKGGDSTSTRYMKKIRNSVMLNPNDIDYEKSDCYSRGNYGQIFTIGDSSVNDIKDSLLNFEVNGEKIIKNVYNTDEHFHGDAVETAPDVLIETENYHYLTARDFELGSNKVLTNHVIGRNAEHRPIGFFAAGGNHISSEESPEKVRLEDFLPTIFSMLNLPVPNYTDGEVISGINVDVNTKHYDVSVSSSGGSLSQSDRDEIEDQLESLGYKT